MEGLTRLTIVFFSIVTSSWFIGRSSESTGNFRSTGTCTQICKHEGDFNIIVGTTTYHLCHVLRSDDDVCPHLSTILIPKKQFKPIQNIWVIAEAHLSYADDVLKDITRPRTRPRTVSNWFDTPKSTLVFKETRETTARFGIKTNMHDNSQVVPVAIRVKKATSGQMSSRTVAENFLAVQCLNRGLFATISKSNAE